MARPVWSGSLSFGLVSIPVEVHLAVRDSRPRFRMLHAKDRSPITLERVCQREGQVVAWKDLVKGYEYEKGRFVVLDSGDLKAAGLEKTKRIDVLDFVKADEIDDRFFDKPYYLTSGKGGEPAYALLREAIRASHRVGIAKFVLRDVQHLAGVEVIGEALVLSTLRFPEELVEVDTLRFPSGKQIQTKELDLAKALIENLAGDWEPDKYVDDYRKNVMRVIQAKLKGQRVEAGPGERPREPHVIDLMKRLRQSLEVSRGRSKAVARERHGHGPARPRKRSARRRAA